MAKIGRTEGQTKQFLLEHTSEFAEDKFSKSGKIVEMTVGLLIDRCRLNKLIT